MLMSIAIVVIVIKFNSKRTKVYSLEEFNDCIVI